MTSFQVIPGSLLLFYGEFMLIANLLKNNPCAKLQHSGWVQKSSMFFYIQFHLEPFCFDPLYINVRFMLGLGV